MTRIRNLKPTRDHMHTSSHTERKIEMLSRLRLLSTLIAVLFAAPFAATAAPIDFSAVNLHDVMSGQVFSYTVGSGPATGTVTVTLISGMASSVEPGLSPDATGFYALQYAPTLPPMTFHFAFDTPRDFIIAENETQATCEVNAFTLSSGAWSELPAAYTTATSSGSTITFVAWNNEPPYGDYAIKGTGSWFDFQITNSPKFPYYGSAISVNVIPEPNAALLVFLGLASFCRRRRTLRSLSLGR